jgi:hypothetical protein
MTALKVSGLPAERLELEIRPTLEKNEVMRHVRSLSRMHHVPARQRSAVVQSMDRSPLLLLVIVWHRLFIATNPTFFQEHRSAIP